MTTTTITPDCLCPLCGHKFNRASDLRNEAAPCAGDFSICIHCAGLLVFDADLLVRKPTQAEREIANNCEAVFNAQLMVRRLRKLGNTVHQVGNA